MGSGYLLDGKLPAAGVEAGRGRLLRWLPGGPSQFRLSRSAQRCRGVKPRRLALRLTGRLVFTPGARREIPVTGLPAYPEPWPDRVRD